MSLLTNLKTRAYAIDNVIIYQRNVRRKDSLSGKKSLDHLSIYSLTNNNQYNIHFTENIEINVYLIYKYYVSIVVRR